MLFLNPRSLLVLCLLGGCTPLTVPPAPPPTQAAADDAPKNWWQRFGDPLLDQLVSQALESAPDMGIARARLQQARAGRDLAAAGLAPRLLGSLGAGRNDSGGNGQTHYQAGFDASWEADVFSALRYAAAGAAADHRAAVASLAATRVSLAAEVALNYTALRAAQQRLVVARANLTSQSETLEITGWRAQAGLVTQLDVEQARTNLEQTRATLPALESNAAEAAHHLGVLTGQSPAAMRIALAEARPIPTPPEAIAFAIPADTLRRRPDLRAAELAVAAEAARLSQRQAARYPSFSLDATFNWQAATLAGLGGTLARTLSAAVAATLFDGGRLEGQVALQDAVAAQALANYEKTLAGAFEEVENALAAYANGREREAARRRAVASARNAATLARQLYGAGQADFQKVLESERTLLSVEDGLITAQGDVLNAVIRLYKAMGGGWASEG